MSLNEMYDSIGIREKETWVEGMGSTFDIFEGEECRWIDLGGQSNQYAYYHNYLTDVTYPENAELYEFISYYEHEYIPFLQSGNAWVINGIGGVYSRYMIADTTVINEKEYSVLTERWVYINKNKLEDVNYKTYLREEGKKVYQYQYKEGFVPVWHNTEHLFFDFGAQKGDSIVFADWDEYKLTLVIDDICQTVLDNKVRDVFYVSYIILAKEIEEEFIDGRDIWIEGIGPTIGGVFDCKWRLASGTSWYYCFHNYNTGYTYPEDVTMLDFSAVHATPSDANTLTLHRNGNALMAVFPTASAGEAITHYDATGRVVATQPIRTGATTATIDITALPAGVYIARLNSGATAKVVL